MNKTNNVKQFLTLLSGKKIPSIVYGTAWKKDKTSEYVSQALKNGFIGIDTACQPKHYNEPAVGSALSDYLKSNSINRDSIYIQTKYTFPRGHDDRIPYNVNSPFSEQVKQSFSTSLKNLNIETIDSLLLHGPYTNTMTNIDWEVWSTMTELKDKGKVIDIGVSNISAIQLSLMLSNVKVKPSIVQNRCYARFKWDKEVRSLCKDNGIIYQGFSLLTANQYLFKDPYILSLSSKYKKTVPQVIFRFCIQLGMCILTGTTSEKHMKEDLDIFDFSLEDSEVNRIEDISESYKFN